MRGLLKTGQCEATRKAVYGSRRKARRSARMMLTFGDKTEVYRCPDCGGWHLRNVAKRAAKLYAERIATKMVEALFGVQP